MDVEITPDLLNEVKKAMQKSLIKFSDMNSEIASEAVDLIVSSIDKQPGNHEAAARYVKEQMDRKFGEWWHCIIGEGFSFEITFQQRNMMYLYYQNLAILLYKC
eukprot:TRINITY_DN5368_c0_g3_i1.p1 TRINITY_DN5368_c0_g3~~TRINITY_DN5368_c0_g3_i1.p1  ORF type:complete len:104 (+),score=2.33 TRINITY_DN5368_c0_g3_i1:257-568(+)